jgi:hypothetical protein
MWEKISGESRGKAGRLRNDYTIDFIAKTLQIRQDLIIKIGFA